MNKLYFDTNKYKFMKDVYDISKHISDITLTIPASLICLTWNAKGRDLTIKCSVQVVNSKNSISIVDPFGNNRVQCTLSEPIKCSGSYNHVLHEDISQNITTLTLKTVKRIVDGEWKCQFGKEEAKSYISHTEGIRLYI